jgi:hypothetical protein
MRNTITKKFSRRSFDSRFSSLKAVLQEVDTLRGPIDSIDLHEFRQKAFIPEKPILITTTANTDDPALEDGRLSGCSIPAAMKWFEPLRPESVLSTQASTISNQYLSPFRATILPYELVVDSIHGQSKFDDKFFGSQAVSGAYLEILNNLLKGSPNGTFVRFNAPLSLFLQACRLRSRPQLYIAQAQIADLPKQLQDDLPIPKLVQEAGKGDLYDANVWMGIPPTYTPLHKDPNPNLFLQLASSKRVRIFRPSTGASMFRQVQQSIGQTSSSAFRGEEMMEGPERFALDEAVWGQSVENEGYEVIVSPGDALFIPKGWWHSIKSIGSSVTASVNWWFR